MNGSAPWLAGALVCLRVGGQRCALPVERVRDVVTGCMLTPIPLAPADVAGCTNLRGRVALVLDLARRLRLGAIGLGVAAEHPAVVLEHGADLVALLADQVDEVEALPAALLCPAPPSLPPVLARVVEAVFALPGGLVLALHPDRLLAAHASP